jgi:hypothetical protein
MPRSIRPPARRTHPARSSFLFDTDADRLPPVAPLLSRMRQLQHCGRKRDAEGARFGRCEIDEVNIEKGALPVTTPGGTVLHDISAEQQLLGACLIWPDAVDLAASILEPEHFFEPVHAKIF